jgi:hypothetical protein
MQIVMFDTAHTVTQIFTKMGETRDVVGILPG